MFLGGEIMINQAMGSMTRRMLLGTSMVALAAIGFQAAPADAEELVLKYNRWLPTTHPQDVEGLLPFFDEVAEVTEGRVRIEPTTAALAPPPRQMEAVKAGVVDIAYGGQPRPSPSRSGGRTTISSPKRKIIRACTCSRSRRSLRTTSIHRARSSKVSTICRG